jgi:integrase/recombinase XerD
VQDVLLPSGALRDEVSLRAAITKGCLQRCVYLSHAEVIEALDRYMDCRIVRRLRVTGDFDRYPGFEPASKLILTYKGYKFHLNTKRRLRWAGEHMLLGHAELDHVRPYLQVSQKRLEDMFTNVL